MKDFIDSVTAKLDQKIDEEKAEIDAGSAKDARRLMRVVWGIGGAVVGFSACYLLQFFGIL